MRAGDILTIQRLPWHQHVAPGADRNQRRMVEEELRESAGRVFQAYGILIETVTSFKYMGRVLMTTENDWPEVVGNLRKARKS